MKEEKRTESDSRGKDFAGGRGKETLFRVSARNQIDLISIADNKANMITGINVILISLIIAAIGSGFLPSVKNIELILPFSILMTTCLISTVFAILSAKPTIIRSTRKPISLMFFQNFYQKTQEEYLDDMHSLLSSRQKIYDSLIIDMYNNGKVLKRKYALLSVSYTLFLLGVAGAVLSFLITIVFG